MAGINETEPRQDCAYGAKARAGTPPARKMPSYKPKGPVASATGPLLFQNLWF